MRGDGVRWDCGERDPGDEQPEEDVPFFESCDLIDDVIAEAEEVDRG